MQLRRRARALQPLPYYRLSMLDRQQMLQALCDHVDPLGAGSVGAAKAEATLSTLNPRSVAQQGMRLRHVLLCCAVLCCAVL